VYRKTVFHFENEERLGKVCVLHQGANHIQSPCPAVDTQLTPIVTWHWRRFLLVILYHLLLVEMQRY